MMAWLQKLIGGFLPIGTKPFPEWAGKIIWAAGICIIVNFILGKIFPDKPNTTTIESGGTQIVQQAEPRDVAGFGCNIMRAYIKTGVKTK